jgi:hypothetical protein
MEELDAPLESSEAAAQGQDLRVATDPAPTQEQMLPVVQERRKPSRPPPAIATELPVPFGSPEELTLEPDLPAPARPVHPAVQPEEPRDLPGPRHPAVQPDVPSAPVATLPFGAPPTEADVEEARSLTFEALEDKPEEAPVVTAEQAAKPYVTQELLSEVQRVEESEAAGEALPFVGDAGQPEVQPARAPLLLDVTANTLSVATVGGFVEVLVSKNSPLPIEKRHLFTTGADFQERAVIKVVEGESNRAEENHMLGEVELVEMRKAVRGEIKIEVIFEITVDGILQVSARNLETGEAQTARLTLFGG